MKATIVSPSSWSAPPSTLTLAGDEVHVWSVSLHQPSSQVHRLLSVLAADEQTRAERFRFQKDRDRFIVARSVLRLILGRYLNCDPERLVFHYNAYGKPALVPAESEETLHFNISHSAELALYAVNRGRKVGIDLEHLRSGVDIDCIAARFFSPGEVRALRALPVAVRHEAFFRCWTRKEAYIKARGEGLSLPLDQFEVTLTPGQPAALLSTAGDPPEASRWSLQDLTPTPGYVAALAVEGSDWRLACWQYLGLAATF